jgi:pyridoxamine 5'-phosphate oxidase
MLRDIRNEYQKFELSKSKVKKDPLEQLNLWLNEAIINNEAEPTSMILSTLDPMGNPESRVVLLKELTDAGLIFFTNYESKKGYQISADPHVSLVFFWPEQERQVRIKGIAEKISEEDSVAYFLSRPTDSQLGAWASPQSRIIENRQILEENFSLYQQYFQEHEIIKPPHWGGFLIRPVNFEFWQGRMNRMHDRFEFCLSGSEWIIHRLAP